MSAYGVVAGAANGFFNRSALALKTITMSWPRQAGYMILPRTRHRYSQDNPDGLGSPLVVSAIGWIVRNFTQAPVRLRSKTIDHGKTKYDDIVPSDSGPGAFLSLLDTPNSYYSGRLMWKATVIDYEATGEAFWIKLRNASGRVVELWWVPGKTMRPISAPDGSDYITYYEYNPNGIPIRIKVDDVVHFRDGLDPRDPRRGWNKLASLAREIFTDDEAANFSATILANMGVPGVIIAPKDTGTAARNRIDDPEGVKQSYMDKFSGDKRGEPLILTSPTDVQILSFSPQALNLKDLRRIPEERISGVIGIPAIVAGFGAGLDRSTFHNYDEARQAAWEEKVIPMHGDMASDLKVQLLNEFVGDINDFALDFDPSDVRVLQADQDKLWMRAGDALVKGGITRRRYKELIGEETDEETDDVYYLPTTMTVINAEELPPPTADQQAADAQAATADQNAQDVAALAAGHSIAGLLGAGAATNSGKQPPQLVGK